MDSSRLQKLTLVDHPALHQPFITSSIHLIHYSSTMATRQKPKHLQRYVPKESTIVESTKDPSCKTQPGRKGMLSYRKSHKIPIPHSTRASKPIARTKSTNALNSMVSMPKVSMPKVSGPKASESKASKSKASEPKASEPKASEPEDFDAP